MKEVNPNETTRAYAFEMWMKTPMPMVTLFKTLDVTRLRRLSRKHGKEFYMLPVGEKLMLYDKIAVNTIVLNRESEVSSCDIPYSDDLSTFNADYLRLTSQVAETCKNHDITDSMIIGTSALAQYDIDGAVGMYSGIFNNPFLIWGRYRKSFFKTHLTVSFQFHHTQMDGAHAARFLSLVQMAIDKLQF